MSETKIVCKTMMNVEYKDLGPIPESVSLVRCAVDDGSEYWGYREETPGGHKYHMDHTLKTPGQALDWFFEQKSLRYSK